MKKLVRENLFESLSLNEGVVVAPKDWDRMLDLVLKGDDGDTAAKLIKDKNKAIARFVAGLKLKNQPLSYDERWKEFRGYFSPLGDKALSLGATIEEIQNVYDETTVPQNVLEKQSQRSNKKLKDRFVGSISKAILDAGGDITFLPYNGYAMTPTGKDAMSHNGRKWTIGYKSMVDLGDGKKLPFNFDAITDEGGGGSTYVVDYSSDIKFKPGRRVGVSFLIGLMRNAIADVKK